MSSEPNNEEASESSAGGSAESPGATGESDLPTSPTASKSKGMQNLFHLHKM